MTTEQIESVMMEFNLSSESFKALPRGLASELLATIRERDALREALHDAASVLSSVVDVHPEWPRAARFLTNARAALALGGKGGA
jgi:hypothetical protein